LLTSVAFAQDEPAPKVDIFGGYSWMDAGGRVGTIPLKDAKKGFGVASTFNFNKYAGLTLDADAHYSKFYNLSTVTFGPRFKYRDEHFQPFMEAMVGLHRLSVIGQPSDNGIGIVLGGGFDIPVTKRFGWRLIQADYVWAHHNISPGTQNLTGARLRSGILFNLGTGAPPVPLAASCSINPASVMAGEPVTLTTTASNIQKNHTVTYAYQSTGGKVEGKETTATIDTNGLAPGSYTVTATVTDPKDKKGVPATCNGSFTVQEPPKHPPTISCSANPTTVQSGQPSTISCTGQSPDNRPLTYNHTATGGRLTPNGPNATLDTAGAPAGPITVNSTVSDDRNLTANTSTSVNVEVPPPPPAASKLNEIQFKNKQKPARVDNEAKAILDDVALRLQRDADAKAVIIGNSSADEKNGASIAQQRAVNTKAYLTAEKGIDPARIELRTGNAGTQTSEIWIVPTGATFNQEGAMTFDEMKVKSGRDQYPGQKPAARRPMKKPAAAPPQ
jgi:outer membrane protein OmpA-like peptidoglycan-associated protein